jgi:hypothetical protein
VGALDEARSYVDGRGVPLLDVQGAEANGAADDVGDGVDRSYFVEVDFLDRDAVDFALGLGQELEGVERQGTALFGERCVLDQLANLRPASTVSVFVGMFVAAVLMLVGVGGCFCGSVCVRVGVSVFVGVRVLVAVGFGVGVLVGMFVVVMVMAGGFGELSVFEDVDLGGADAAAVHVMNVQLGSYVEGFGGLLQKFGGDSGVEERSQEHVSADAGKAFEISDTHRFFDSLNLCFEGAKGYSPAVVDDFPERRRTSIGRTSFMDPER